MSDPLRAQYEAYPYPARDPADERKRLVAGAPSHILEIDHYLFAGRRDFARPFRALFAGGRVEQIPANLLLVKNASALGFW